jgi:IclR helix-turn-helix domain
MMNRSRTVESGEVKSAGRVLDILDLLAARGKLTLTEIAHAMRMPKSSTYGILKTAVGGPIIRNRTFFFGSYQITRARTSFVDEATNTRRLPRALTDDRSDDGINRFAQAVWATNGGPVNFAMIDPISRALLKARFPDGSYMIPSGSNGIDCARLANRIAESCAVVSVIPATFDQDQFSVNIDHQLTLANKFSGKFFFTNQPSIDPLANGNALTLHERNEQTQQRTLSLTDLHVFGPRGGQ